MKKGFLVMALLMLLTVGVTVTAHASQFMNITFDGDTIGSSPSTGGSGSPIGNVGALGGYNSTAQVSPPTANEGTIKVGNVAGMNKAAVMTTNSSNAVIGALYMDTGLSVFSSRLGVTFDIAVLNAPATATLQGGYSLDGGPNTSGVLFGLRTYASDVGAWAFSFAVVPTSDGGGVFALRDSTNTMLTSFGSYENGQAYSIALDSDYTTGTVDAYVNGVLGLKYSLRTGALPGPTTTSELFIYLNGEDGIENQIAIDNIQGYTSAVPLPAALWLFGPGLAGLAAVRRRLGR